MRRIDLLVKVKSLGGFSADNIWKQLIDFVLLETDKKEKEVEIQPLGDEIRRFLTAAKARFQKHNRMYERIC